MALANAGGLPLSLEAGSVSSEALLWSLGFTVPLKLIEYGVLMWGPYNNMSKAISYLPKGDYRVQGLGFMLRLRVKR